MNINAGWKYNLKNTHLREKLSVISVLTKVKKGGLVTDSKHDPDGVPFA